MNLREARKRAGMSMKALADAAGVTAAAICRYEQGARSPKTDIAKRLGKILGVPWYQLVDNRKEA